MFANAQKTVLPQLLNCRLIFMTKRKLFTGNWSYKEGFIISIALVIIALIMEYITKGSGYSIPSFPYNLAGIISFSAVLVLLSFFEKTSSAIRFLGSVPAAITSIILVTILAVLLGSIPQNVNTSSFLQLTGLNHLTSSYLFFYGYLYFLVALGLTTIKRIFPLKKKNIGFLLNHLGLYVIIVSAIAGSGDIKRLYVALYDDNPNFVSTADGDREEKVQLPISLRLIKFNIEEYNPKLFVVETQTGDIKNAENKVLYQIDTLHSTVFQNWDIRISKFLKYAHYHTEDSLFKADDKAGAVPVAFVEAVNKVSNDTLRDWITSGNYVYQRKNMQLDPKHILAMAEPEAKTFMSDLEVKDESGELHKLTLKVNEPATIDGWKLYQVGYNNKLGKWSNYSVVEVGRDNWLPAVYVGIFMLIFGAIYILWIGKNVKNEETKE